MASSFHGASRTTIDVDLVADLPADSAGALAGALSPEYYVDEEAIADAIRRRSSFNVIHLDTMLKVDVFVLPEREYERQALERCRDGVLEEEGARTFPVATPEDTVLHKLHWYRLGAEVAERQWKDAVGVLKVLGPDLDLRYMRRWAEVLKVGDLLSRAMGQAGLEEP